MSKTAYLIISDLHFSYKNLTARFDYNAEIDDVLKTIIDTGLRYKELGYKVHLIFLGDVAHNSFKSQQSAIYFNNIFVYLSRIFDDMSLVAGNHEFSYYKDNPFWSLFNTMGSTKVSRLLNKSWQPKGFLQLANIRDTLEDGEVIFHFNHYGTEINRHKRDKINIGLFHQDIICKAIVEDMTINLGMDIFESKPVYFDKTNILTGYDYCFFGHLHKVYGKWVYTNDDNGYKTTLYYLASLGRTNQTEVQNNFLERNIPAIIINNGKLEKVEDNKFNLKPREKCVKEDIVALNQAKYLRTKDLKNVHKYLPSNDDPIENLKIALSEDNERLLLFEQYLTDDTIKYEHDILTRVAELRHV